MLLEGIELEFQQEALAAIVARAKARRTGARGLRGVMEEIMNPIMYHLPDQKNVRKCIITGDVVEHGGTPILELHENQKKKTPRSA